MIFNNKFLSRIYIVLILTGCQNPIEDRTPPEQPKWVEKSTPYAWEEKGIDAENSGNHQIKLEWHRVKDEDLAGYRLFSKMRESEEEFQLIGEIDLFQIIGLDTVFYYDVEVENWYQYYIRAVDNADNLSEPSDTIEYLLLNPPRLIAPLNTISDNVPSFTWATFDTQFYWANYFAVRVEDVSNLQEISTAWTCFILNNWIGLSDPIILNYIASDSSAWPSNVLECKYQFDQFPAGTYRWKVIAIFTVDDFYRAKASGESEWGYFEVE
ncbi:MAG: hypothetical protein IIA61_03475 [Candidatus Marinimicrobia bacterium]|nr:hypothetical protein [Candidatus Neomarinimicrobiota bacterium]